MSDSITIKELLDLTESIFAKMSDITLEATIKDVKQAYERKVKSGEREGQVFYSQKLTIDDDTGSIVVDFIAGTAEDTIPKSAVGRRVRVEDAKTDIYKSERRLAKGKLTPLDNGNPSQGSGVSDLKKEERNYWDNKQKRQGREITRIALAKSLIEAGRKWGSPVKKEADDWYGWVMDGKESKDAPEKKETTEEKETSARVALRKTWQGLNNKLADKEYWTGRYPEAKTQDEGYRFWLDDEYGVSSSTFLTDEQMEKGIKMMSEWLNNLIKEK